MDKKLIGALALVLSTHTFAEAQVTNPPIDVPPIEMPPRTTLPTAILSWGADDRGQLGNGEPLVNSTAPTAVTLAESLVLAAGYRHALTLRADGTVWATTDRSAQPVAVSGLITYTGRFPNVTVVSYPTAVAAGQHYSLARKSDGSVWAWGSGQWGTLGQGTLDDSATPVQVQGPDGANALTDVIQIAAGGSHALALTADGRVYAWGRGDSGQLGDGNTEPLPRLSPVRVHIGSPSGSHVIAIAAGTAHSLALESNGTVWAWGAGDPLNNKFGLLGVGNTLDASINLAEWWSGPGVTAIAGGTDFSLAKTCSTFDTNPRLCDPLRVDWQPEPAPTDPRPPIVITKP